MCLHIREIQISTCLVDIFPILLTFFNNFATSVALLWLVDLPFFIIRIFFMNLDSLRLSYLIFSTTVARDTICYCFGGIMLHFPEENINSYLLRDSVFVWSGVEYYPSPYPYLFVLMYWKNYVSNATWYDFIRLLIRSYVLSPLS